MTEQTGPVDALQLLHVMARQWRVVLTGLAVTALATVIIVSQVPTEHEATGKVVIEAPVPDDLPDETARNPFVAFNPALSVVGDVIAQVVTDDASRQRVADAGASPDYTIRAGGVWAAPVLSVRAVSRDPEQAVRTVEIVVWTIAVELAAQQAAADADPATFVTARTLINPDRTVVLYGGRIRSALASIVIGLGAALAIALFLDRRAEDGAPAMDDLPAVREGTATRRPSPVGARS